MVSINCLIDDLIDKKSCAKTVNACYESNSYFVNEYFKDRVDESKLIALLKRSHYKWKFQAVLTDILFLIEESGFTDKIIDMCIKYPGRFRKTLLTQLSHVWLEEKQLEKIITATKVPEACCKLLIIKARNKNTVEKDLMDFIKENRQYLIGLEDVKKT